MAPFASKLLFGYYGDDFTGSTDALEFLTRAGVSTALFIDVPTAEDLMAYPGLQAVGISGKSRSLSPEAMEQELRPAFEGLRALGVPEVHYKVCSTFDSSPAVGSIGKALELGRAIFGPSPIPVLGGAPHLGRYCAFGNLFARMGIGSAGAVYRLDRHPSMRQHPVTPATEADLRLLLAQQSSLSGSLVDFLQLEALFSKGGVGAARLDALADSDWVLFDALCEQHLRLLGLLLGAREPAAGPRFWVGPSSVELALGAWWQEQGYVTAPLSWPEPGPAAPLLVLSGSCSPVTAGQIQVAAEAGFYVEPLDAEALAAGRIQEGTVERISRQLAEGKSVVAHTALGPPALGQTALPSAALGTALGLLGREVLGRVKVRRLLIAGGDSSSYASRALGIGSVTMLSPLAPGAPLCLASAPGSPADGLEINFKGGQVGSPDYFLCVARGHC